MRKPTLAIITSFWTVPAGLVMVSVGIPDAADAAARNVIVVEAGIPADAAARKVGIGWVAELALRKATWA